MPTKGRGRGAYVKAARAKAQKAAKQRVLQTKVQTILSRQCRVPGR